MVLEIDGSHFYNISLKCLKDIINMLNQHF